MRQLLLVCALRVIVHHPSPGPFFTLLICVHFFFFPYSLYLSLPCLYMYYVGEHKRAGFSLLPRDWLEEVVADWLRAGCSGTERKRGGGAGDSSNPGLGGRAVLQRVGVFVLRWELFKPGEERVKLVHQRRTENIGADSSVVSRLSFTSPFFFFLFFSCSRSAMCSCASLPSSSAALAALTPKCSTAARALRA